MDKREAVRVRILAYILPCVPRNDEEKQAVETAIDAQLAFEQGEPAQAVLRAPGALSSFQIGNFSAAFRDGSRRVAELFPAGLDSSARATLLLAGLLYRGVGAC